MLVDTHCHLNLPPLNSCLDELLAEARAEGIERWIVPSLHPDDWDQLSLLTRTTPGVRPAFGIHPLHAATATTDCLIRLERIAAEGVAIGEIGLDGSCDNHPLQEQLFRAQLRIARNLGLPVLIHCRRAIGRTIAIIREEGLAAAGGIMHAFSSSCESARDCLRLNLVLSVSGIVTRPSAIRLHRVCRELPLEQLVLETDAPDLTPFGRGRTANRPAWLLDSATALAQLKGCSIEELAQATTATVKRVVSRL
jgi:TatD DNase family protein